MQYSQRTCWMMDVRRRSSGRHRINVRADCCRWNIQSEPVVRYWWVAEGRRAPSASLAQQRWCRASVLIKDNLRILSDEIYRGLDAHVLPRNDCSRWRWELQPAGAEWRVVVESRSVGRPVNGMIVRKTRSDGDNRPHDRRQNWLDKTRSGNPSSVSCRDCCLQWPVWRRSKRSQDHRDESGISHPEVWYFLFFITFSDFRSVRDFEIGLHTPVLRSFIAIYSVSVFLAGGAVDQLLKLALVDFWTISTDSSDIPSVVTA